MTPHPQLAQRDCSVNPLYGCYVPVGGVRTGDGRDYSSIYCFGCGEWRNRHVSEGEWPEVYVCRCGFETRTVEGGA